MVILPNAFINLFNYIFCYFSDDSSQTQTRINSNSTSEKDQQADTLDKKDHNNNTTPPETRETNTSNASASNELNNSKSDSSVQNNSSDSCTKGSPPNERRSSKIKRTKSFSSLNNSLKKEIELHPTEEKRTSKDDLRIHKEEHSETLTQTTSTTSTLAKTNTTIENTASVNNKERKESESETTVVSPEASPRKKSKPPLQRTEKKIPVVSTSLSPRSHTSALSLDTSLSQKSPLSFFLSFSLSLSFFSIDSL
jgi:hypothetical protein